MARRQPPSTAKERGLERNQSSWRLDPSSRLQNYEKISVYCLSHPLCGILFRHPSRLIQAVHTRHCAAPWGSPGTLYHWGEGYRRAQMPTPQGRTRHKGRSEQNALGAPTEPEFFPSGGSGRCAKGGVIWARSSKMGKFQSRDVGEAAIQGGEQGFMSTDQAHATPVTPVRVTPVATHPWTRLVVYKPD